MGKKEEHKQIAEDALRDREAGRYDPPQTWWPTQRVPIGSPERNVYDNVNPNPRTK